MTEPGIRYIRYVFLDVVGFTRQRSVETQAEIVASLTEIVKSATKHLTSEDVLYLPTGDGMCICVLGDLGFDVHIQIALGILSELKSYNEKSSDKSQRFSIRIGINENSDNVLIDINGMRNVAGDGINMASRIMNLADGNQIFVSTNVHAALNPRQAYMGHFRPYSSPIKHGANVTVYQYVMEGKPGLNIDIPSRFRPQTKKAQPLSEFEAYYISYAWNCRELFLPCVEVGGQYPAITLLWFLASDAIGAANSSELNPYRKKIAAHESGQIADSYKYYSECAFWLTADFADFVEDKMDHILDLFRDSTGMCNLAFPNEQALNRLRNEHPKIAAATGISLP